MGLVKIERKGQPPVFAPNGVRVHVGSVLVDSSGVRYNVIQIEDHVLFPKLHVWVEYPSLNAVYRKIPLKFTYIYPDSDFWLKRVLLLEGV